MRADLSDIERMGELASKADHASLVLKCVSNKWRLLILCQLVKGEKSVGALERAIGLRQSALSQHLGVLRNNKLVNTRRDARTIYYSISGTAAPAILGSLYDLFCQSNECPESPENPEPSDELVS